jgi:hypothetical protein
MFAPLGGVPLSFANRQWLSTNHWIRRIEHLMEIGSALGLQASFDRRVRGDQAAARIHSDVSRLSGRRCEPGRAVDSARQQRHRWGWRHWSAFSGLLDYVFEEPRADGTEDAGTKQFAVLPD